MNIKFENKLHFKCEKKFYYTLIMILRENGIWGENIIKNQNIFYPYTYIYIFLCINIQFVYYLIQQGDQIIKNK